MDAFSGTWTAIRQEGGRLRGKWLIRTFLFASSPAVLSLLIELDNSQLSLRPSPIRARKQVPRSWVAQLERSLVALGSKSGLFASVLFISSANSVLILASVLLIQSAAWRRINLINSTPQQRIDSSTPRRCLFKLISAKFISEEQS